MSLHASDERGDVMARCATGISRMLLGGEGRRRHLSVTVALALALACLALFGVGTAASRRGSARGPARARAGAYTVVGNQIRNSNGKRVLLAGVNRPSLEWSCVGDTVTGTATGIPASDFTTMVRRWHANSVRIDLNQDMMLRGSAQYCPDYEARVEAAVRAAQAAGMIVILDDHGSDAGNLQLEVPTEQCMPDRHTITFWRELAVIYRHDPGVWFELYNEPVPPDRAGRLFGASASQWRVWLGGGAVTCPRNDGAARGTVRFQAVGMQTLYDTVRATGSSNIVIVDGLDVAGTLAGVPLLSGTNVVYAIHPYIDPASPDDAHNRVVWNREFGDLSAKHAVLATEFGDFQCGNAAYDNAILSFMNAHKVGYDAWAWFVGGCRFPSLITDAAGDCVKTMGCVIQANIELLWGRRRSRSETAADSGRGY
jgi:endoglucanase